MVRNKTDEKRELERLKERKRDLLLQAGLAREETLQVIYELIEKVNQVRLIIPEEAENSAAFLRKEINKIALSDWKWIEQGGGKTESIDLSEENWFSIGCAHSDLHSQKPESSLRAPLLLERISPKKESKIIGDAYELIIYKLDFQVVQAIFIGDEGDEKEEVDFSKITKYPLWDKIVTHSNDSYLGMMKILKDINELLQSNDPASVARGLHQLEQFEESFMRVLVKSTLDQQIGIMYTIHKMRIYGCKKNPHLWEKYYDDDSIFFGWGPLYEIAAGIIEKTNDKDLIHEVIDKKGEDVWAILKLIIAFEREHPELAFSLNIDAPSSSDKRLAFNLKTLEEGQEESE